MSKQNNTNEEDYLDNLLTSVLNGESESIDDIFGDELKGSAELDDDFFMNIDANAESETDTSGNPELFVAETAKESIVSAENESSPLAGLMGELDAASEEINDTEETNAEENVEQDMQGLMDILGVEEETAENTEEIVTLEKSGKKKKKKEKKEKKDKKKKKLFGKKDEPEESMAVDVALDLLEQTEMENASQLEELSESADNAEDLTSMSLMDALENNSGDMDSLDDLMNLEELESIPEKDSKKKKEKKPKKAKNKKPKKPKKKKQKKLKAVKGQGEIIPFSGKALLLLLSLTVLTVLLLIFGSAYSKYNNAIKDASTYFVKQNYGKAYEELVELPIKEKDMYFYNQVKTVMYVYNNYETYEQMMKLENYEAALDSLLNGVKMYDKYKDVGRDEYNCFEDLTVVLSWITDALEEDFKITESQAREINLLGSGKDYSYSVAVLAAETRERIRLANDSDN